MEIILAFIIAFMGFWGLNFTFWGLFGLVRYLSQKIFKKKIYTDPQAHTTREEVAIIVPAHNEELVVAETIRGALRILPKENIFIITSDFERKDKTAEIARSFGVNVWELPPPLAKASKLQEGVRRLKKLGRFKAVLFVDADTVLAPDYLTYALPHFDDPEIVAIAGHASTLWEPEKNTLWNQFFISYRERVWFYAQFILRFGQTWTYTNVTLIVPGFASMYRMSVLEHINIDPGGLVIEDYNMTFEMHHKNLGKIAYDPRVKGYTQDPDNLKDYFKQIKRWNLGFWQTVFRHGYWTSGFWFALSFFIMEVSLSAINFVLLPFTLFLIFITYGFNPPFELSLLVKGIFVADYSLTIIIAVVQWRLRYLFFGFGFMFLRFVDSLAYLYSIPKAVFANSTGFWISPTRR